MASAKSPFSDAAPTDKPPKFDTAFESEEAPKVSGLPRATPLKAKLTQVYAFAGTAVFAFDPYCGRAILTSAESAAEAMDQLARENPAVKRVLEALVKTSALGTVIAAHMPIIMAIAMHHGPENISEIMTRVSGAQVEDAA